MTSPGPGPCSCAPKEAREAHDWLRNLPTDVHLIDESHYGIRVQRCRCGQRYLHVFYELIDWENGDDSQATVTFALSATEGASWSASSPPEERDVLDLPERRQLVWVRPRGDRTDGGYAWIDGAIFFFPHE